jgi:nucleotide-binding universal stress UspA family protein
MRKWRLILCPIDFSSLSLYALKYAVGLCRDEGAKLVVLHVVEPILAPADFSFGPLTLTEVEDQLESRAEKALEDVAKGLGLDPGLLDTRLERGRAFMEIVRIAEERRPDLIVMATHGHTGLSHALLGSTAEKVVRKAPCPVLTLKPPDADS